MQCFEPQHLFGNPLDETMVMFKNIDDIFDLQDFNQLAVTRNFKGCRRIYQ